MMITTIIIVGLAYAWLLYESRWLTVRLLIGAEAVIIEYQRKSWEELEPRGRLNKQYPFWLRFPEHMVPLCGLAG